MAENLILAQVLAGISALKTKAELDVVRDAVKDRREKLLEGVDPFANGNSDETIRVNKQKYDYSDVKAGDLLMAEKWYMAPRPSWRSRHAYNQWRVWNWAKTKDGKEVRGYKGNLIIEKATGRSVSPPQWESEGEDEEVGEEVREATEAMAGVRVE